MAEVKIYTTKICPYCVAAKKLLESKGVEYQEIDLTGDEKSLQELKAQTGMQTVPQIFINGELIGGCDELHKLNATGELDKKLS